jgi:hypothetical protein
VVTALRLVIVFSCYLLGCQDSPSSAPVQEAKADFPSRDELKIVVIHDGKAACSDYTKTFRCPDVKHWVLSVNDVKCADRTRVEAFIKSEAERLPSSDPNLRRTDLEIKLLSESGAPYSEAAGLMNKCAKMGIYRLEIGEKKTGGHSGTITSALGVGTRAAVDHRDLLILIGKQKPDEFDSVRWVEGVGLKEAVEDTAIDFGPRDRVSVLLDPIPSTPWAEVIQMIDLFKKMGFERTEFAAPRTLDDTPKK